METIRNPQMHGVVASPRPNCAGDDFPDFWLCYKMEGAMCRLSLVFVKDPSCSTVLSWGDASFHINFTPQRRVSWDRTVSLQKRLLGLLLRVCLR